MGREQRRQLVPAFVLEKFWAGERHGQFDAAILFVDTVGFSGLSTRLTKRKDDGAEILAEVMGRFFTRANEAIFGCGGFVENISGDSVTAVFPGDAARLAISCAHAIQAFLDREPMTVEDWRFSARLGLASGPVSWRIFSSDDGGDGSAAYCFDGPPIAQSVKAQELAKPGMVVAHSSITRAAGATADVMPLEPDYFQLGTTEAPALPDPQPPSPAHPERYAPFLPKTLVSRRIPGEFRQIVSMFVRIEGVSDAEGLEGFTRCLLRHRKRWGGICTRLNIGDKGVAAFQFWGAPEANEHDVSRAISFAIGLASESPVQLAFGISLGHGFTGFIGSARYAEFAGFGQPTNTAARIMTAAPTGAIWVDAATAKRAARDFELEDVGAFSFKGFSGPEKVFAVTARRRDRRIAYDRTLFGRAGEARTISDYRSQSGGRGPGGALLIRGDAGVGKSHLLDAIGSTCQTQWLQTYCDPLIQSSLEPFRRLLRSQFGSEAVASASAFERKLAEIADACGDRDLQAELGELQEYIADFLGRTEARSALETVDPQARLSKTMTAIMAVIRALAGAGPTTMVIEDTHWLDPDSKTLLQRLIRRSRARDAGLSLAFVLTSRPSAEDLPDDIVQDTMDLRPIGGDDLKEMIQARLGGPSSAPLLSLVQERTQGNPLFVTHVLRFLDERGMLEEVNGIWHLIPRFDQLHVPGDIGTLLVARIDELTETARDLVAIGAVLGTEFDISTLQFVARKERVSDRDLHSAIQEILQAELWFRKPNGGLVFGHALTRDAAYSMQIVRRRRELHALAADVLRKDDRVEPGILARHYDKSGQSAPARSLYLIAADRAEAAFERTELIEFLERAIDLSDPGVSSEKFELGDRLAETLCRTGDFRRQIENIQRQETWAEGLGPMERIRTATRLQAYHFVAGDRTEGVSTGTAIARNLDPSLEGTVEASTFLRHLCMNQHFAVKSPSRATEEETAEASLLHAQKSGQPAAIAASYATLGHIHRYVNDPLAKAYYEKALDIGPSAIEAASILNRLASIARRQGDLDTADTLLRQVLLTAKEVGDLAHLPLIHRSLLALSREKMDWQQARHHARNGQALSLEIGNMTEARSIMSDHIENLIFCGLLNEAWPLSLDILDQINRVKSAEPYTYQWLKARIAAYRGDSGWMAEARDEFLPRLQETGFSFDVARMLSLLACAYLNCQDLERAQEVIAELDRILTGQEPLSTRYAKFVGDASELRALHKTLKGHLLVLEKDPATAAAVADEALEHLKSCLAERKDPAQRPDFPEAPTFCLLCELLEQVGRPSAANETFQIWRTEFDTLMSSMVRAGHDPSAAWKEDIYRSKLMSEYEAQPWSAPTEVVHHLG